MKAEEEDILLDQIEETPLSEKEEVRRQVVNTLLDMLGLSDWVTYSKVMKQAFFVLFLVGIGIFHIFNAHRAEGMIRQITILEREIKELRWEYTSVKSDLMMRSKLTDLEKVLEPTGLKSFQDPPQKIVVSKNEH